MTDSGPIADPESSAPYEVLVRGQRWSIWARAVVLANVAERLRAAPGLSAAQIEAASVATQRLLEMMESGTVADRRLTVTVLDDGIRIELASPGALSAEIMTAQTWVRTLDPATATWGVESRADGDTAWFEMRQPPAEVMHRPENDSYAADAEELFELVAYVLGAPASPEPGPQALLLGLLSALTASGDPDDVFTATDEHGRRVFIDNPLSRTAVAEYRSILAPLQSRFEEHGHGELFTAMIARLDEIEAHATGVIDWIPPAPVRSPAPSPDPVIRTRSPWTHRPKRRTVLRVVQMITAATYLAGVSRDSSYGSFGLGEDVLKLAKMSPDMWDRLQRVLGTGYEIEYGDVPEGADGVHRGGGSTTRSTSVARCARWTGARRRCWLMNWAMPRVCK